MAYLSLYRKYRSQSFDEVSGQDHVTRTLQNAVRSGRVAHAYLFCGPRGTGKTTTARLLAKALNCEQGPTPEPCNECGACTQINEGRFLDMKEIDAASNRGIDEIRNLRDNVAYAPVHGRYKVYVIDEAHQITGDAFNAFLKTLEEPPPHVVFIMATTEAHKIPATIVSRCQRFEFRRASLEQLRERVAWVSAQEGASLDDTALDLIARDANGGWRDALSLLEQVLAFSDGPVTARDVYTVLGTVEADTLHALGESLLAGDGASVFRTLEELVNEGKDPRQLLRDLTSHFRGLMLTSAGTPVSGDPEQAARLAEQARAFGHQRLVRAIEVLAQTEREARWSEQPRLLIELALVRLLVSEEKAEKEERENGKAGERGSGSRQPATPSQQPAVRNTPTPAPSAPAPRPSASFIPASVPPPLTVGDARAGDMRGEDDSLAAFDEPPPESDPFRPSELPAERVAPPPSTAASERPTPNTQRSTPKAERSTSEPPPTPNAEAGAIDSEPAAFDIELVRRKWKVILEELNRARKVNIGIFLAGTQPDRFEKDTLVLRFDTATMAEGFERRGKEFSEPLVQAIGRVTGVQCRVRAEVGKPGAPARLSPEPRSRTERPSAPAAGASIPAAAAEPAPVPTLLEATPVGTDGSSAAEPLPRRAAPPANGNQDELIHNIIEVFDGRIVDEQD